MLSTDPQQRLSSFNLEVNDPRLRFQFVLPAGTRFCDDGESDGGVIAARHD
jgi:hypothetical protein